MPSSFDAVLERQLQNPEFRAYWERTAFARALANRLIRYRTQHGLSQTALGRKVGMSQPAIARLEAGEHDPRASTLIKLSSSLGLRFSMDIHPTDTPPLIPAKRVDEMTRTHGVIVEHVLSNDVEVTVMAD